MSNVEGLERQNTWGGITKVYLLVEDYV